MNIDVSVRSRLSWGPFTFLCSGFQVLVFKTKRPGRETNPRLYLTNSMVQIFLHNTVFLQSRNFLHFMQPEDSLPSSQNPLLLFTLRQRNAVHSHHISLKSILILSSLLLQDFPRGLFLSWFPAENLCVPLLSPIRSTFPTHLIFPILSGEYKSGSFSSFSFFQSLVTSSLS